MLGGVCGERVRERRERVVEFEEGGDYGWWEFWNGDGDVVGEE